VNIWPTFVNPDDPRLHNIVDQTVHRLHLKCAERAAIEPQFQECCVKKKIKLEFAKDETNLKAGAANAKDEAKSAAMLLEVAAGKL